MELMCIKKRLWFFGLVVIAGLSACTNKESAKVKLSLPNYANSRVAISEQRVAGEKFIDSLILSGSGKQAINLKLKQPQFYNLKISEADKIYLLIQPGEKVVVSQSGEGYEFSGSEETVKLNMLYDSLFATRDQLTQLRDKYNASLNDDDREVYAQQYETVVNVYHKFSQKFVLENLQSLTSLAALYQEYSANNFVFGSVRDLQFFKLVTDSLTKYYPKHRHVLALQRNFKAMLKNYQVDRLLSQTEVTEFDLPEISLPDTKMNTKSLSNISNRYIFLNFWNENDNLSHELLPGYRNVCNKYKKDVAVYNVYMGKSENNWKKIIKFEEIEDWINVADTSFPQSDLLLLYNIQSIPTNFLIDSKERIILTRDMTPEELKNKLAIFLN